MTTYLTLKNTHGETTEITLKLLDLSHLPQMLNLEEAIYAQLPDKSWYACTQSDEFEHYLLNDQKILGCFTPDHKLIALAVYLKPALADYNLGYDLDFPKDNLFLCGHIENTIVHPDFRGNKLQQILCTEIEKLAKIYNTPIMLATVCPDNIYSLNTFLHLGYTIKKEKLKYGGLKRYILQKNL